MAGPTILIAAFSGRAAAAAARRAGFTPLVADLFADADTCEIAAGIRRVAGDCFFGFDETSLLAALGRLADEAPERPIGLAYGAGFEDRPALLARIGAHWPLLGNSAETVEAVKDPFRLAATLEALRIPHPQVLKAATAPFGWLLKRQGGAGGVHVGARRGGEGSVYAQRRVAGRSVSALFLAAPSSTTIVGFSEQWTAPAPGEPFRFGGAAAPADIPAEQAEMLTDTVHRIACGFGIRGLNSIDFILEEDDWWLIEINPRLGATLDLFDVPPGHESPLTRLGFASRPGSHGPGKSNIAQPSSRTAHRAQPGPNPAIRDSIPAAEANGPRLFGRGDAESRQMPVHAGYDRPAPQEGADADRCQAEGAFFSANCGEAPWLFAAHIAAIRGEATLLPTAPRDARALQIVYAPATITDMPRIDWPDWIVDRPQPGTDIRAGAPICTVLASSEAPSDARRLCLARAQHAIELIGLREWTISPNGQKSA